MMANLRFATAMNLRLLSHGFDEALRNSKILLVLIVKKGT